jgi:8-oxo-dGTP pyrophosphatase MutT (NUDIX family)
VHRSTILGERAPGSSRPATVRIVIDMTRRSDLSDDTRQADAVDAPEPGTSSLGADWVPGPDGMRHRRAARVIVLDDAGRALLVRGHDADQPERSWWFTVGGGIDPGESEVDAALRELREEAGLELTPGDLVGPVMTRAGIFRFYAETCRQDEVFFVARVDGGHRPTDAGWTDVERELLDEMRWLSADELRAQPLEVFPTVLPDVVDDLARGWDGVVRHLGTQDDDAAPARTPA